MSKRTKGTLPEVVAAIALADKAMGYPSEGDEHGKGPHPSSVPQRRSLGMFPSFDIEGAPVLDELGQPVMVEVWETLHGVHEPFVTTTYDKLRQHPTDKALYDCAALDPAKVKKPITKTEADELRSKWDAAEVADASWDDQGDDEQ